MKINQLLTQKLRERLPALGATASESDPLARAKFFYPDCQWTWYAIEFDGQDLFYGYVDGAFPELGNFSLSELLANRGVFGCTIERDRHFNETPLSVIQQQADLKFL
jgi:hypothetical protein